MNYNGNYRFFKLVLSIGLAACLLSCENEYEPVFEGSPDARLQKVLDEYNHILNDVHHGWKGQLYTATGAGYFYYFDFDEDGTVAMFSDFNETSAGTSLEGTWTLKALQKPTLSFNSYSYVHLPADPDGNVNGGNNGEGLVSDFEFAFSEISGDSIIFRGIQRNTEMVLIKASGEERSAILNQNVRRILESSVAYKEANRNLRLTLPDDSSIPVDFSISTKTFGAQYLSADGNTVESFATPFTFSARGILLRHPFNIQGHAVRELLWDGDKEAYYLSLDDRTELTNNDEPFIFELPVPLHASFSSDYKGVRIPDGSGVNPLPGQSESFIAAYNAAADNLKNGIYGLTLRNMDFVFDPASHTMLLDVIVTQTQNGITSPHLAEYVYTYTVNEEGVLQFSFSGANENAWILQPDLEQILMRLESETYQLEYVGGVFDVLGGFFSQEDQEFYFSGYLLE